MNQIEQALKKLIDYNRVTAEVKTADPNQGSVLLLKWRGQNRTIKLSDNSNTLTRKN